MTLRARLPGRNSSAALAAPKTGSSNRRNRGEVKGQRMQILIAHGYLLTGTGSNLYVSNLARELCQAGHDVYLVCQEYHPEQIDYVQDVYAFVQNNTELVKLHSKTTTYAGTCKVFRPALEQLLPVYVFDHYPGFTVKEFPACSEAEIHTYVELQRQALITILDAFPIEVIQTNHTIMFPYIVSRLPTARCYPHVVTVHGSALNFSVKQDPRLVPYARAGFEAVEAIIVDSAHGQEELGAFLTEHDMEALQYKVHVIPAGVDVERFGILSSSRRTSIAAFAEHIQPLVERSHGRTTEQTAGMFEAVPASPVAIGLHLERVQASYDYRHVDQDVIEKLQAIDWENDRVVLFVGKYLWTKGIHLILLAAPLILAQYPNTKFLFVGFGPFREVAEYMVHCLAEGRLEQLQHFLATTVQPGADGPVPLLAESLAEHAEVMQQALASTAHQLRQCVVFTGIVDHAHLKYLLPCADVLIAPSVFPEAFGMVAIEALACGVLPLVTYQSAFKEIAEVIAAGVAEADYDFSLRKVYLETRAFVDMAQNVLASFAWQQQLHAEHRFQAWQQALRGLATQHYSWQRIAAAYVNLYRQTCAHIYEPMGPQTKQPMRP